MQHVQQLHSQPDLQHVFGYHQHQDERRHSGVLGFGDRRSLVKEGGVEEEGEEEEEFGHQRRAQGFATIKREAAL